MFRARFLILFLTILTPLLLSSCANNKASLPYDPAMENYTADQLLVMGEKAVAKNSYKKGIKYFRALEVKYPTSAYARQAQLNIIYAYYKQGDAMANALTAAERYIRIYPRGPNADYAYYMKGLIYMGRGRDTLSRKVGVDPAERDLTYINKAFANFTTIVQSFPNSPYAPDAYARLIYLRNMLARHELIVAEFYYDKKAYLAAANRAADVVKHYQGAPQVEDALVMMVKSYQAIGEEQLAQNALNVLQMNYPGRDINQVKKKTWRDYGW